MEALITLMQNYLLVSLRAGCLLFFLPPWDSRLIPPRVRVFSVLGLSLALTPLVAPYLPAFPTSGAALFYLVMRELLLGISLGLVFRCLFAGIHLAGHLLSIQMGFGMATLIDPQSQAQNTLLAEMLILVATLLFLAADGHHALLVQLVRSFQDFPLESHPGLPEALTGYISSLGKLIFSLGMQLVAPVLFLLLLTQLALGLIARGVPQFQVMIVGFPLTIALGLFFLSLTLMVLGSALLDQFAALRVPWQRVLEGWKG